MFYQSGDSSFLATDLFLFWNGQAKSKEANGKEEPPHPNRGECSKQRSKQRQDSSRQSPGEQRPTASHAWLLPGNLSSNSLPQQKWLKVSVSSNFKRNKGEMPLKKPKLFPFCVFLGHSALYPYICHNLSSIFPSFSPQSLKCGRTDPKSCIVSHQLQSG